MGLIELNYGPHIRGLAVDISGYAPVGERGSLPAPVRQTRERGRPQERILQADATVAPPGLNSLA
jgi:hypothetical protein